ncbi:PREDICTED: glycine, alanine and asparagine-rich protein-like [Rhagoletis zephyria]|uniref:glycine, alanine and asparagine-rich protein-like n=1 Tax=Rhagoletis zephyria TaxID=28612 RepID=UPI0008119043|nr:PREDICTED: glycine, alanine and asparagine-rich protein-like [Rhagoletis zephyria]
MLSSSNIGSNGNGGNNDYSTGAAKYEGLDGTNGNGGGSSASSGNSWNLGGSSNMSLKYESNKIGGNSGGNGNGSWSTGNSMGGLVDGLGGSVLSNNGGFGGLGDGSGGVNGTGHLVSNSISSAAAAAAAADPFGFVTAHAANDALSKSTSFAYYSQFAGGGIRGLTL